MLRIPDPLRGGAIALVLALAGCAPPPVLKPMSTPVAIAPEAAAAEAARYDGSPVVWGGRIVEVRNGANSSEIVIDAFPLDSGQRPRTKESSQGRFFVRFDGYVESYDYPQGRYLTVSGRIEGSVSETVDEKAWQYVVVRAEDLHLWPVGFEKSAPQVHFSLGVSGGIR